MGQAPHPIRIIICDDHEMVRRGIAMTLASEPGIQVIGEVGSGQAALAMVSAQPPDILLLDIQIPDMDGIEVTRSIRSAHPEVAILILSSFSDDASVYAALRAGVSGYLLKELSGDALIAAVYGTTRGEPQLHPKIARRLMNRIPPPNDPIEQLSQREQEVLRLIASGRSNKEIGLDLELSENTVKTYVREILSKLDVADRTQAALLAVRYGLVRPGQE